MHSPRQPVLTVSPQNEFNSCLPIPLQTTPKLPKRERLNSISRLLKNKNFKDLSCRQKQDASLTLTETSAKRNILPPVIIRVSPCSSPNEGRVFDYTGNKDYRSPNTLLPFSPRLLNQPSACLSPTYKFPSPVTIYTPPDVPKTFLGRGSFGKVTLTTYKGKEIAIKIAYDENGEKNLIGIRHPHLVEVYHMSQTLDGGTLVFMEFAGHCNLQQILDTKSELDFRRRLSFCIQTATGLRHCHRNNIVHCDVKPSNVIVNSRGICKLGDFGHSRKSNSSSPTKDIVGTAAYAAPEVLKSCQPSTKSDVYSFGVLLWQVQTREIPFSGDHPHVIIYKVVNFGARPKIFTSTDPFEIKLGSIVEDCWRTLPSQRIDTEQVLVALSAIMQSMNCGK